MSIKYQGKTIAGKILTEEATSLLNNKADISLNNLDENGEKHFLNKTQITNCLLEVPHRIKCELTDGIVTIKAGSELLKPDGTYYVLEHDISQNTKMNSSYQLMAYYSPTLTPNNFLFVPVVNTCSGDTDAKAGQAYHTWFDTVNMEVKEYRADGELSASDCSLPIFIATNVNGIGITSIDNVFNGLGYMGSHIWIDKGVKALLSNGRNADGTLKNIEVVVNKTLIQAEPYGSRYLILNPDGTFNSILKTNYLFGLDKDKPKTLSNTATHIYYATDLNIFYSSSNSTTANWIERPSLIIAEVLTALENITVNDLRIYNPLRIADMQRVVTKEECKAYIVETYQNGLSWYRVWSDGWCEQGGHNYVAKPTNGQFWTVSLLKPYKDTNYSVQITFGGQSVSEYNSAVNIFAWSDGKLTTGFAYAAKGGDKANWKISSYWQTGGYLN